MRLLAVFASSHGNGYLYSLCTLSHPITQTSSSSSSFIPDDRWYSRRPLFLLERTIHQVHLLDTLITSRIGVSSSLDITTSRVPTMTCIIAKRFEKMKLKQTTLLLSTVNYLSRSPFTQFDSRSGTKSNQSQSLHLCLPHFAAHSKCMEPKRARDSAM